MIYLKYLEGHNNILTKDDQKRTEMKTIPKQLVLDASLAQNDTGSEMLTLTELHRF